MQESTGIFCWICTFSSLILHVANIEVLLFLENWNVVKLLSALLVMFNCHRVISNLTLIMIVSRERTENVNQAWWSGKWYKSGLGVHVLSQNLREFIVKILELNKFTFDFIMGHFLLFAMSPVLFIPYVDSLHTSMLFWLKPSRQFSRPIINRSQRRRRNWQIVKYFTLFVGILCVFATLFVAPPLLKDKLKFLKKWIGS